MLPGVEAILNCELVIFVAANSFGALVFLISSFSSKLISQAMLPLLLGVTGADKEGFGGTNGGGGGGGNDVPSSESSEKSSSSLFRLRGDFAHASIVIVLLNAGSELS